MLLPSELLSCASSPSPEAEKETPTEPTTAQEEIAVEPDEEEYSILSTLPKADFGGDTITALTINEIWWQLTELDAEELNGEIINDQIYNRNLAFENDFNTTFEVNYLTSSMVDTIRKTVSAGDSLYDFIVPLLTEGAQMAADDLLFDLNTIGTIDFANPAWDHNAVDYYSIVNKLYYGVSDISLGKNEAAWIYMFNKNMLADLGQENPYDLVRENRWTFDYFLTMMETASNDANGNGKVDEGDVFGLATHEANYYGLLVSGGQPLAYKDEDDVPKMNIESEGFVDVFDFVKEHFTKKNQTVMEYEGETFMAGRALFCGQVMACVRLFREMEDDFGIIPSPMRNEEQGQYYTFMLPYYVFGSCIPITTKDRERSGIVLQALSIYSAEYLTPAYYDITITGKGLRDQDSAEMLDIILDSCVYDLARVYDWGSFASGLDKLIANKVNIASMYKKRESALNKAIESTVSRFTENEN